MESVFWYLLFCIIIIVFAIWFFLFGKISFHLNTESRFLEEETKAFLTGFINGFAGGVLAFYLATVYQMPEMSVLLMMGLIGVAGGVITWMRLPDITLWLENKEDVPLEELLDKLGIDLNYEEKKWLENGEKPKVQSALKKRSEAPYYGTLIIALFIYTLALYAVGSSYPGSGSLIVAAFIGVIAGPLLAVLTFRRENKLQEVIPLL